MPLVLNRRDDDEKHCQRTQAGKRRAAPEYERSGCRFFKSIEVEPGGPCHDAQEGAHQGTIVSCPDGTRSALPVPVDSQGQTARWWESRRLIQLSGPGSRQRCQPKVGWNQARSPGMRKHEGRVLRTEALHHAGFRAPTARRTYPGTAGASQEKWHRPRFGVPTSSMHVRDFERNSNHAQVAMALQAQDGPRQREGRRPYGFVRSSIGRTHSISASGMSSRSKTPAQLQGVRIEPVLRPVEC